MRKVILLCCALLSSCGPSSLQDLRVEAESESWKLAKILHAIDTKDDLEKSLPSLKKRFCNISKLILQVRKHHQKEIFPQDFEPSEASDQLFTELARLYEMPGCRELIESAQEEAVDLLR